MKKIINFLRPSSIIGTLPNTIANGQTMDAVPVMADLNWIVSQVNANAAPLANTALLDTANVFTARQSGIAATAGANFPIASQVQNSVFLSLTSTLGTNTITARCAALAVGAYTIDQMFVFTPSQTNTGAVGITIDSAGSSSIFNNGFSLVGGELRANIPTIIKRDASKFNIMSPVAPLTLAASQSSASGTAIDFTGIPVGVKRITVMFGGVSTNGTSAFIIQIGTAGGVEATGYTSTAQEGANVSGSASGFQVTVANVAASTYNGAVVLNLLDNATFFWVENGDIGVGSTTNHGSNGRKALSAVLDRVRITMANGTDAFDSGLVSISYE